MKEAQTHRSHTRKLVGFTVRVNPTQAISCEMGENMTLSPKNRPKKHDNELTLWCILSSQGEYWKPGAMPYVI